MTKKAEILAAFFIILSLWTGSLQAARIITVDDDGPADFNNIQAAINDANNGDTIEVQAGTYTGNGNRDIDFLGKVITVRSVDPNDPNIIETTIIDCNNDSRGFYFHSGEGADSVLAGLTITNGYTTSYGGGIVCINASPKIESCRIISCRTRLEYCGDCKGGGIYCEESNVIISHCVLSDNWASGHGGAIFAGNSNLIITQSEVTSNSANYIGGIACWGSGSVIMIKHCTITDNSYISTYAPYGEVIDCFGAGIYVVLNHCIVWGNNGYSSEIRVSSDGSATVSYCDVEGGYAGKGNFDADPCFVDPNGNNYHLSSYSPCINTGDPCYIPIPGETDIDGDERVINGIVDIGCDESNYEGPLVAVSPGTFNFYATEGLENPEVQILHIYNKGLGILNWEVIEDCPWIQIDPNSGESTGEIDDVNVSIDIYGLDRGIYSSELLISDPCAINSPQTVAVTLNLAGELHVPSEYGTIQEAIDDANFNDKIIVADGIFTGNGNRDMNFNGKAITLCSENGPTNCIIDVEATESESHRAFLFNSGEGPNSIINGFTITGGYMQFGGSGGLALIRCSVGTRPII